MKLVRVYLLLVSYLHNPQLQPVKFSLSLSLSLSLLRYKAVLICCILILHSFIPGVLINITIAPTIGHSTYRSFEIVATRLGFALRRFNSKQSVGVYQPSAPVCARSSRRSAPSMNALLCAYQLIDQECLRSCSQSTAAYLRWKIDQKPPFLGWSESSANCCISRDCEPDRARALTREPGARRVSSRRS